MYKLSTEINQLGNTTLFIEHFRYAVGSLHMNKNIIIIAIKQCLLTNLPGNAPFVDDYEGQILLRVYHLYVLYATNVTRLYTLYNERVRKSHNMTPRLLKSFHYF